VNRNSSFRSEILTGFPRESTKILRSYGASGSISKTMAINISPLRGFDPKTVAHRNLSLLPAFNNSLYLRVRLIHRIFGSEFAAIRF